MKMNFGCGPVQPSGWVNVDCQYFGQDYKVDILNTNLWRRMFQPDSFDFIIANHSMQEFTYDDWPVALSELGRVMKPGGHIRILVPDMWKAIRAWTDNKPEFFPISDDLESTLDGKLARYLHWHGQTRSSFTGFSLIDKMERNGFKLYPEGQLYSHELDSRQDESIILEFVK